MVALKFPGEVWLGQIYGSAKLLPKLSKKIAALWIGFQLMMFFFIIEGSIVWGLKILWIYLLFFVLPSAWVAVFSRYLRLLSEHFGIPSAHQNSIAGASTRTVLVSWPIRIMLWPHNLNYHLEHHWYPSVPFYNLPALHKLLYESPEIRERMHITKGLKPLFRELTAPHVPKTSPVDFLR
jgi:fatty acid desaturase